MRALATENGLNLADFFLEFKSLQIMGQTDEAHFRWELIEFRAPAPAVGGEQIVFRIGLYKLLHPALHIREIAG